MATRFRVLKKEGQKFCVVDKNKPAQSSEAQEADNVGTGASSEKRRTNLVSPDESGRYQTDIWSDLLEAVKKKQQEARTRLESALNEDLQEDGETALRPDAFPLPGFGTFFADGRDQRKGPKGVAEINLKYGADRAAGASGHETIAVDDQQAIREEVDGQSGLDPDAAPYTDANPVPDADMSFEMFCRRFVPVTAKERKMMLKGQKLDLGDRLGSNLPPPESSGGDESDMKEATEPIEKQAVSTLSHQSSQSTITPLSPVFTTNTRNSSGLRVSDSSSLQSHYNENVVRTSATERSTSFDSFICGHDPENSVPASKEAQRAYVDLKADAVALRASPLLPDEVKPRSDSASDVSDKLSINVNPRASYGSRKSSWGSIVGEKKSLPSPKSLATCGEFGQALTPHRTAMALRVTTPNSFKSTLRVSKEEPRISLHTGSTPFTPRHSPALSSNFNTRSRSNTPQSLDKHIKSILRTSDSQTWSPTGSLSALDCWTKSPIFSPTTPSPCDLLSQPRIGSGNPSRSLSDSDAQVTDRNGSCGPIDDSSIDSKAGIIHKTPDSSQGPRKPSAASSTSSAKLGNLTTPEKTKLVARSPYGNRPSPRSKISLDDDDEEGDQSIKTTAVLVDLCRAGPPPLFHPSETSLPAAHSSDVSLIKKKRSFKDLCRDIVTTPSVRSTSGQKGQGVEVPPLPTLPLVVRRKRSVPNKLENAFNSIGRKAKKKRDGLEDAFQSLNLALQDDQGSSSRALHDRIIYRSGSNATGKWSGSIQEIRNNNTVLTNESEWTTLPPTPGLQRFQVVIPIEVDDEKRPQSRLPELVQTRLEKDEGEQRCSSCDRKCSFGGDRHGKSLVSCQECRSALVCKVGLACNREHMQVCPMIQRPHTSFRTHMSYLPEPLRVKASYLAWQKGVYVDMHDRLEQMSTAFHKQLLEGQGRLLKDLGKELAWSTSKISQGIKGLDELELDAIQERLLRRVFMMPKLAPRADDPSSKHPNHSYHRKTASLNCLEHHGHCANCGVECCVVRAIELDLRKNKLHPLEVQAMQAIHSEVVVWMRRGEPSIMMQCTACIAEGCDWKHFCPNCFGVCPVGCDGSVSGCGDVLCVRHQSKPNTPCEWHWR